MSTQFHTQSRTRNRNILGMCALLSSVICMADDPSAGADVTSQAGGAGGAAAAAPATGTGTTAVTKVTEATIATVEPHPALLDLIKNYDEVKEKATSYMCDQAELIAKENIGRPQVIKSLMVARGVTLETAQSSASRMIKLSKSPEQIAGLRDGSLTIRETLYGRPKPGATDTATGDEATAGAAGATPAKKTDTEKKEDKYNRLLKEFTDVAKASGYDLKSIIAGVTAALKDAGIK